MSLKVKFITILTIIIVGILLVGFLFGFFGQDFIFGSEEKKPVVMISYPSADAVVSRLVMISGTASHPDADGTLISVHVRIGNGDWMLADGTELWSYHWITYSFQNGPYEVSVRCFDGKGYSDVVSITLMLQNPVTTDSGSHKWAIFIAAANFPLKNETKLGNGGLYLAENIAAYLITHAQYPPANVMILFDDGWIRTENGYGTKLMTLQERVPAASITYGAATKQSVLASFQRLIVESNAHEDSEVFIWMFNHGVGNMEQPLTGGKIFEASEMFLWDATITDKELGRVLDPLTSSKVTVIVDACYSGGFADRSILDRRTSLLFRSGIPKNGRIVISGTSKFTVGYASTLHGPIFSLLWFEGLSSGAADGFRAGLFNRGVPTRLKFFQDGKVSVEEAFYYANYMLRTHEDLKDFSQMRPQMNDKYPKSGLLRSRGHLILGEN